MRKATYSDRQIIEAGQRLLAAGKQVNAFAIRNALGGGNRARIRLVWETAMSVGSSPSDLVASRPFYSELNFTELSMETQYLARLQNRASIIKPTKIQARTCVEKNKEVVTQLHQLDGVLKKLLELSVLLQNSNALLRQEII